MPDLHGRVLAQAWRESEGNRVVTAWWDDECPSPRAWPAEPRCTIVGRAGMRHVLGDRQAGWAQMRADVREAEALGGIALPWWVYEHGEIQVLRTPPAGTDLDTRMEGYVIVPGHEVQAEGKAGARARAEAELEAYGDWLAGRCWLGLACRIARGSEGPELADAQECGGFTGRNARESGLLEAMGGGRVEWIEAVHPGLAEAVERYA